MQRYAQIKKKQVADKFLSAALLVVTNNPMEIQMSKLEIRLVGQCKPDPTQARKQMGSRHHTKSIQECAQLSKKKAKRKNKPNKLVEPWLISTRLYE